MNKHNKFEDLLAIGIGTIMVSLGVYFFNVSNMLTGGTAGFALLLVQFVDLSFGQLFFLINIPFFMLGLVQMGRSFTLRSLLCVSLVSTLTDLMPLALEISHLSLWYSAVMGGFLVGTGMLILFRHNCSLGGVNILALFIQERFKIAAGKTQMGIDGIIVFASFLLVPLPILLFSILGVITLNIVIALNHKQGRYQGLS